MGCQLTTDRSGHLSRGISSTEVIDLVFDLDWTLVSELIHSGQEISSVNRVTVHGLDYRINDWAIEMITELSQREDVRISFFSGGKESRNTDLLSKLKLADGSGRSFLDIAHKVKSYEDLYEIPTELVNGEKFTDRFRKDLRKINNNLDRVVLIDDNYRFAINETQRRNILWLGPTYIHYERVKNFPHLPVEADIEQFVPRTQDQWFVARNKLLLMWGLITDSLESGEDFIEKSQSLTQELDIDSGQINQKLMIYYNEKFWLLKKYGDRVGRLPQSNQCKDLIKVFF